MSREIGIRAGRAAVLEDLEEKSLFFFRAHYGRSSESATPAPNNKKITHLRFIQIL